MLDWLERGGPVLIPILGASVLAFAVFFAKVWRLRRAAVIPEAFVRTLFEELRAGRPEEAHRWCRDHAPSVSAARVALAAFEPGEGSLRERLERRGRRELAGLERFVGVVGIVATIEPLLGLLGTVLGMMDVFASVSAGGLGDASALSAGVGEALITTAAGLLTGIPAYLASRWLEARVDAHAADLEELASRLAATMEPT